MPEVDLDDPSTYARLDPSDMFRRVSELPEQIDRGWNIAGEVSIPEDYRTATSVVITGMGGSAIGGSLVEGYAAGTCPVPVAVHRGYGLPGYVGPQTLVIGVSYSGNTEETLSALKAGRDVGAKLIAITTGGRIMQLAREWEIPLISFQYDAQPRAALGFLFTPLLSIFERLGFLPAQSGAVAEAIQVARDVTEDWGGSGPEATNLAKQLARRLHSRAGIIYGADYLAAVARRWKTQLNENSKTWAFYEEFSELNHNAIVGYEYPTDMPEHVEVIILKSPLLPERITIRVAVTERLLEEFGISWHPADARGRERLAHIVSLIALGDYVSYYLALLNGADPTVIRPIDTLKEALTKA